VLPLGKGVVEIRESALAISEHAELLEQVHDPLVK